MANRDGRQAEAHRAANKAQCTYRQTGRRCTREADHAGMHTTERTHANRHDPAKAHTLRPGRVYLCIGPNCWGKAFDPQDAEANARKEWSGRRGERMPFLMFDAPPDVYVDGMGSTVYTPALYTSAEDIAETTDKIDSQLRLTLIGERPREIYRWGTK